MDSVIDERAKCCLYCLRLFSQEEGNDRDLEKSQQFLKLLKRYLLNQYDSDSTVISTQWIRSLQISSSNKSVGNAMAPCMDCSGIINSFCEYYEEIRILEMKLQWRLETLTNIVESSDKVKLRQKFFQVRLEQVKELDEGLDVVDLMKRVKSFRTELVKLCSRKFRTSFPRVFIWKCDSIQGKEVGRTRKRPNENAMVSKRKIKRWRSTSEPGRAGPAPPSGSGVIGELFNEVFQPSEASAVVGSRDTEQLQLFIKTETPSLAESTSMSEVSSFEEDYHDHDDGGLEKSKCNDCPSNPGNEEEMDSEFPRSSKNQSHGEDSSFVESDVEDVGNVVKTETGNQKQRKMSNSSKVSRMLGMRKSAKEDKQNHGVRVSLSLRQRFRCKKCWRNFGSKETLENHVKLCEDNDDSSAEGAENKIQSQSSEDSDFENTFSGEVNLDEDLVSSDDEETPKTTDEKYKHKGDSYPYKNYDFMKTLFKCPEDNCSSFFYNQSDLDYHSKLHGTFQCSSCSCHQNFSYAPDLALHELQHALSDSTLKIKSCPRKNCFYIVHERKFHHVFVSHFLRAHLDLTPNLHTCPVCSGTVIADDCKRSNNRIYTGSWKISNHFKVNHDDDDGNAVFPCDVPACPAYFLQETQLQRHKRIVHCPEKDGTKPQKLLTCKRCPSPGGQFTRLALDRHNFDCHGDKYGVICKIKGCRRRFRRTRNLMVHVKRDHGDSGDEDGEEANFNENDAAGENVEQDDYDTSKPKTNKILRNVVLGYKTYNFMKTVFKCRQENCDSFFYNQLDLDNHSKCHGIFKCSFCDETMSYAPDLARHELQHAHDDDDGSKTKTCPRENCFYTIHKGKYELNYISHFLQAHLQLTPNVHTCPVCSITVYANDSYQTQCKNNREIRRITSGSCKLSQHYKVNHDLNQNGVGVAEDTVIQCDFPNCKAFFLKATQLRRHKKIVHHTEKDYVSVAMNDEGEEVTCKLCKDRFKTQLDLHQHKLAKHGNKYGKSCDVPGCQKKFRSARQVRAHVARDHGNEAMACAICTKTFSSKDDLLFHQNQVHRKIQLEPGTSSSDPQVDQEPGPDQVFQCSVTSCTEKFFNQENLQGHMKLHGIFPCQFCDETLNYAPNLALHELSSHKIGGKVKKASGEFISCPRCSFRDICTELQYVQHHLKFHLDVEIVVKNMCHLCKFVFKENSFSPKTFALHYKTQHDLSRTGNNSGTTFRCEEDNCDGAYFLRADQFNIHNLIVHNKREKKLECPKCGKWVLTSSDLINHNRRFHVPKEEWKHVCDECGKKCITSSDLRCHKLTHVSDKPYACEHCGSMYKTRDKFKKHLKKLHGVILEKSNAVL